MPRGSFIGAAGMLAVILVIGVVYFFVLSPARASDTTREGATTAEVGATVPGPMHVMKDRIVNLADTTGRRYLKVSLSIEFLTGAAEFRKASVEERKAKQAEFDKHIAPWAPLIDDAVISLIAKHTLADISTSEGKVKLKNDIKDNVNSLMGQEQVANVYFTQFVTQ